MTESEPNRGVVAILIVAVVVIVWISLPTLFLTFGWAFVLGIVADVVGVVYPPIGQGILLAVGIPRRVFGVPTVYPVVCGFLTTVVWYWRTGGGSSENSKRAGEMSREERRWEL